MSDVQTPATAETSAAPIAATITPATPEIPVTVTAPKKSRKRKLEIEMSDVERFKALLQKNLGVVVNTEISQDIAYKIFQESFNTIVEHVAKSEKKRLSLVGIGRFYIKMSAPRKIADKPESHYAKLGQIPHFRWKPSFRFFKWLVQNICNVDVQKLIDSGEVIAPISE